MTVDRERHDYIIQKVFTDVGKTLNTTFWGDTRVRIIRSLATFFTTDHTYTLFTYLS